MADYRGRMSSTTRLPRSPFGITPSPVTRLLVLETVLVLGVSLGRSAWYSVLDIIDLLTRKAALSTQTSVLNVSVTPDRPWLDLAYQLSDIVFPLVPVGLALYLLATVRPPDAGVARTLGVSPRRPVFDIGWSVLLFVGIGVPGLGLYLGARAIGINTTVAPANLAANWWTIPVLVLSAAMNGLLEETVMLGYLFARWRQAGWTPALALVVSALIRGSYHLYQGFGGFIGNFIMGLIFGTFYLRTRRLWPLIGAHLLLDVTSFVGYSLLHGHVSCL